MKEVQTAVVVAFMLVIGVTSYGQTDIAERTLLPKPSGLKNDIFHQPDSSQQSSYQVSTIDILNLLEVLGKPGNINYDLNADGRVDQSDLKLLLLLREERE
jgi:hypothetical protein